ncbi:MAG: acyl carrier protein [Zoogloeaceae bacterium]|nr:acyl carrier protein [Zoogloeaceae bacterium]
MRRSMLAGILDMEARIMGLDTVELVLDVEDWFGIEINDSDAVNMHTPGDVADYVIRIRLDANAPCRSQAGFYRMRSVLMRTFGIPRKNIHPATRLDDLWKDNLRDNWQKLETTLELETILGNRRFPRLRHTPHFVGGVIFGIPVALALCLWFAQAGFMTTLSAAFCAFLLIAFLTRRMGSLLPETHGTVGSLLPYVVMRDVAWPTREAVLKDVIRLVSRVTNLPAEKIREHSRFVDDLGMG